MTYAQVFLLHALLKLQRQIQVDGGSGGYTICSFIDAQLSVSDRLDATDATLELSMELKKLWVNWPKYSGMLTFPVPSPDGTHPGSYFLRSSRSCSRDDHLRRWSGDYGESRKDLLNFLIAKLQEIQNV